jgi:hypothetical protein
MKLNECLNKYKEILGHEYSNLGKKTGFGCGGRKVMLAYSKKHGWSVKKLNILQLFFRNFLGAYKSTRLNHVVKKLNKLDAPSKEIEALRDKLLPRWSKKNVIRLGNAPLEEANVIGFPEDHLDVSYRAATVKTINEMYQDGDVVLVEGVARDQDGSNHQQVSGLKPGCLVRGWEPDNFEELYGNPGKRNKEIFNSVFSLYKAIDKIMPKEKGKLTEQELADVKVFVDKLKVKIPEANKYYKSKMLGVLNAATFLENWFDRLKKGTLSVEKNDGNVFRYLLKELIQALCKNSEKAFHKNITREEVRFIMKGVQARNASLIHEIKKYRSQGRRVFVIAGAFHLLHLPKEQHCKVVKEGLATEKTALFARKQDFTRGAAKLNPDLAKIRPRLRAGQK